MGQGLGGASKQAPLLTEGGQPERIVNDKVYIGPAYGLPSVVGELHYKHKKVKCLSSENKTILLYSLPTNGVKTMVVEIIMFQGIVLYAFYRFES